MVSFTPDPNVIWIDGREWENHPELIDLLERKLAEDDLYYEIRRADGLGTGDIIILNYAAVEVKRRDLVSSIYADEGKGNIFDEASRIAALDLPRHILILPGDLGQLWAKTEKATKTRKHLRGALLSERLSPGKVEKLQLDMNNPDEDLAEWIVAICKKRDAKHSDRPAVAIDVKPHAEAGDIAEAMMAKLSNQTTANDALDSGLSLIEFCIQIINDEYNVKGFHPPVIGKRSGKMKGGRDYLWAKEILMYKRPKDLEMNNKDEI
jgi:hypothetical protein